MKTLCPALVQKQLTDSQKIISLKKFYESTFRALIGPLENQGWTYIFGVYSCNNREVLPTNNLTKYLKKRYNELS